MPKYSKLVYTLLIFVSVVTHAQQIKLKISGAPTKATIMQLEGEKATKIDSVRLQNDYFKFSLEGKHNGFYRIQFDKKNNLTFINDGTDVEISTSYENIYNDLKVEKSNSNKLFYQFNELNKAYKKKNELLNVILSNYPEDDKYYAITKERLLEIQSDYRKFVEVTSQKKPNSFIARYIKSAQLPIVGLSIPQHLKLYFLKKHSLDKVDFNDAEMIYSDLFANKSIEYLMYYRNQQLPKALLESEFMKAVDTLLNKAKVNELVYKHTTDYLIDGFTKFGFDKIIDYIVENYVIKDNICIDSKLETTIQKRIDQAKYLGIGKKVPNIILPDTNGTMVNLKKIKTEKVLILFYASWCPHCKKSLPDLVKLYNNQKTKKIEILAVSIDENRAEWTKIIKDYKLNWLNVSDLKGWDSKSAKDYHIYATPTMFLLNKGRKIIAKPITIDEVSKLFSTL